MPELIKPSRRGFLTGLGAFFVAAPAIVRATSIMPVKAISAEDLLRARMDEAYWITREAMSDSLYGQITSATRAAFVPRLFVQLHVQDSLAGEKPYPFREWVSPVIFNFKA